MAGFSKYLANKVVDFLFRGQPFTPPSTLYMALFTTAPNRDGTGGVEVNGTGYARIALPCTSATWEQSFSDGVAQLGVLENKNDIAFTYSALDWGVVRGMALFDAASGGTMMFYAPLTGYLDLTVANPQPIVKAGSFFVGMASIKPYNTLAELISLPNSGSMQLLADAVAKWLFLGDNLAAPTATYIQLLAPYQSAGTMATRDGVTLLAPIHRAASIANNLTNWSGTQGVTSTAASTGDTASTANNVQTYVDTTAGVPLGNYPAQAVMISLEMAVNGAPSASIPAFYTAISPAIQPYSPDPVTFEPGTIFISLGV